MKWRIDYSREAEKFIRQHDIRDEVREEIKKFLLKMKGENVNIHLKKLGGDWEGYYRLRKGKLRIIFGVNIVEKVLFVERVDFRGDVYK
jgi:mRNA interferase RelE/StbE